MSLPAPIPLFVLTGFLGSGKTTLLGRILRSGIGPDVAVLINEFGQVGLDHRIVTHVAETSAVVQNGCLCCSVRPELQRALLDLLRRRLAPEGTRFDRIVIETSGLSDPAPIINTIATDPVLREHFRVAGVITTVDAVSGLATSDNQAEFAKQVAVADRILITKTDLAAAAEVAALRRRLAAINPVASLGDARAPDLRPETLLEESGRAVPDRDVAEDVREHDVRTFSVTYDSEVDWSAFVTWLSLLLNRHGREVLRLKGLLHVAGEAAPVLVHGVQHMMHPPEHMAAWPDADRSSQLVFIVRSIEPDRIRRSLSSFLDFARTAV